MRVRGHRARPLAPQAFAAGGEGGIGDGDGDRLRRLHGEVAAAGVANVGLAVAVATGGHGPDPGGPVIKDLKDHGGLSHLPSGIFNANAAWLTLTVLAHNLGRWTLLLGKGIDCWSSTKTLRRKLVAWPARIVNHARQTVLHAPADWPWADAVHAMLTRLRALPAPT
ncbi:MAG: transposase [Egibacteraceae bacterium]